MHETLNIDRDILVTELMAGRHCLAHDHIIEADVSLIVFANGDWNVRYDDVQYHTEHGVACGTGNLNVGDTNAEIESLADDLIKQVTDQIAEAL